MDKMDKTGKKNSISKQGKKEDGMKMSGNNAHAGQGDMSQSKKEQKRDDSAMNQIRSR